jgi:hypothetical protein
LPHQCSGRCHRQEETDGYYGNSVMTCAGTIG